MRGTVPGDDRGRATGRRGFCQRNVGPDESSARRRARAAPGRRGARRAAADPEGQRIVGVAQA
eukprot:5586837-Pyramimonas_sp.AAC.1